MNKPNIMMTKALPSPDEGSAPKAGPVLYCGDPHGNFAHVLKVASHLRPSAVILLGDMEAQAPVHEMLAPIADITWWIPGNHDTDSNDSFVNLFEGSLAPRNIHGRVVQLPDGTRVAGLGGVFRESVWYPSRHGAAGEPKFRSLEMHANATPRRDRFRGGPHRRHWSSIYPDVLDRLASERADVLVTHEAPGYHRIGFEILDTLAQALGVKVSVHGHHHDALNSSARWAQQGFKSFGVGHRGITAIDIDGNARVIVAGELDSARARHRMATDLTRGPAP